MFTRVVVAFVPQTTSFQMSGTIEQQEGDSLKWKVPKGITEIGNLNWQSRRFPSHLYVEGTGG